MKRKTRVAIKKLTHDSVKEQDANLGEIGFLSKCDHPNIVKILDAHLRIGRDSFLLSW